MARHSHTSRPPTPTLPQPKPRVSATQFGHSIKQSKSATADFDQGRETRRRRQGLLRGLNWRRLGDGKAIADGIPFVGADTPECLPDRHALHRNRMAIGAAQLRQRRVTNADDGLKQHAGHDREPITHALGIPKRNLRSLASPHHVEKTRPLDETRHCGDLLDGLRRLHKRHVGAGRQRRVGTADRLLESEHCAAVGARNDEKVRVAFSCDRRPDFRQVLVKGNNCLVVEVPALFWEALVFDMQAGDATPLIFPHRASRIEHVAVTRIRVGNDRHIDSGGNATGIVGHLGHSQEPVIRIAQRRRGPGAGHVDSAETGLGDRSRRYAIISAGRDRQATAPQQVAELPSSTHHLLHIYRPASTLTLADLMIGHHFSISALWYAPSASAVCCSGGGISWPRSSSRWRTSLSASACMAAFVSVWITFFGVPLGTHRPDHVEIYTPGAPASSTAGISGAAASRALAVIA